MGHFVVVSEKGTRNWFKRFTHTAVFVLLCTFLALGVCLRFFSPKKMCSSRQKFIVVDQISSTQIKRRLYHESLYQFNSLFSAHMTAKSLGLCSSQSLPLRLSSSTRCAPSFLTKLSSRKKRRKILKDASKHKQAAHKLYTIDLYLCTISKSIEFKQT